MNLNLLFQKMKSSSFVIFMSLVTLLLVARWVPHPHNFTPLLAVALFSGSFWRKTHWRFVAPLFALFISDAVIGFYPGIEMNYIALALSVLVAPQLAASLWSVGVRSFLASALFFVVSNLGVWLFAGLYPLTLAGLQTCFILAVPFFSATLGSTLLYSVTLYSLYRFAYTQNGFEGFLKLKHG